MRRSVATAVECDRLFKMIMSAFVFGPAESPGIIMHHGADVIRDYGRKLRLR
jgi:hypothetical protein